MLRLSNSGLKIGDLINFIMLSPFLATDFALLPIFMIDIVKFGCVTLSCKEPISDERNVPNYLKKCHNFKFYVEHFFIIIAMPHPGIGDFL